MDDLIHHHEFEPAYEVEVGPEFPPDGEWSCPVYAFDHDGHVVEEFVSRWGAPLALRVKPREGAEWVGLFPAGGLGGVDGVFACPAPAQLCVVVDGLAFLLDVDSPATAVVAHDQVGQVVPVLGVPLLLLVRFIDIVAIGPDGVAWRSPCLALDGLRVLQARADGIRCVADTSEGVDIVVDPATGEPL
jgi:hypothetical protein